MAEMLETLLKTPPLATAEQIMIQAGKPAVFMNAQGAQQAGGRLRIRWRLDGGEGLRHETLGERVGIPRRHPPRLHKSRSLRQQSDQI